MEINHKINNFAKEMQIELDNNAHKGNIEDWTDIKEILIELEYHKGKLLIALKENNQDKVKEYIADCGNILMAIGNKFDFYIDDSEVTVHTRPCSCGRGEKLDGEYYCKECLIKNPFLCA